MKDQNRTARWHLLFVLAAFLLVVSLSPSPACAEEMVLEQHPRGLLVSSVDEGSFTSSSGLMPGDIIREADFKPVANTPPETFQDNLVKLQAARGSVVFKIERSGEVLLIWMRKSPEFKSRIAFDQTRESLENAWAKCEGDMDVTRHEDRLDVAKCPERSQAIQLIGPADLRVKKPVPESTRKGGQVFQ